MMTQVLRDSLGGNCRTVMIANITAQHEQLDESISTCRFAQRVAMVSNQVSINPSISCSVSQSIYQSINQPAIHHILTVLGTYWGSTVTHSVPWVHANKNV